jgi:hypothetical protein
MKPLHEARAGGWDWIKPWVAEKYPGAQAWYTERNGDSFFCVMPAEAKPSDLPKWAGEYQVVEWIDPDKEFGTGHRPYLP